MHEALLQPVRAGFRPMHGLGELHTRMMRREAVALVAGRVPIEASGGVRLDTIAAIAATGVTYVSVGRLTQSAPAADIGLDFTPL